MNLNKCRCNICNITWNSKCMQSWAPNSSAIFIGRHGVAVDITTKKLSKPLILTLYVDNHPSANISPVSTNLETALENIFISFSSVKTWPCIVWTGPWFKSYTGLTWISQCPRNESPRLHSTNLWIGTLRRLCLCKLDIPGRRMLAAHKTGSEIVSPGRPER